MVELKWSLSTGMWMQAHEARKCRFCRDVDAGTGGQCRVRRVDVSSGGTKMNQHRHGHAASRGTGINPVDVVQECVGRGMC